MTRARQLLIALTLVIHGCGVTSTPPAVQSPPQPTAPAKTVAASKTPVATAPHAAPPPPTPAKAPPPLAKAPPTLEKAPPTAAAAPLDLKSLEQRLKDTGAIGVLTKLSLKNQVDDLVERFRAFHRGQKPPGLAELRPAFDLLVMKVLSLLQDKDAALAKDIDASRNAIWNVLTDREKLANFT
jgi:hypothetical protein